MKNIRVIISGGGTGGHIFPAISIANAIKQKNPEASILFVGAEKRMEMGVYRQPGMKSWVCPSGIQPQQSAEQCPTLIDLLRSMIKAGRVVSRFKPDGSRGCGWLCQWSLVEGGRSQGESQL